MSRIELDQPDNILEALVKPTGDPKMFTITLSGFKKLFKKIQTKAPGTKVDIVLNGEWTLVQFSELCNHSIKVLPDSYVKPIQRFLGIKTYLEERDFELATSVAEFYGQRKYLTVWRFIKEEILSDGFTGFIIFITAGLLLTFLSNTTGLESIEAASDVLIGISAIFFSIFILFTASQNIQIVATPDLFKSGLTHRFVRVDRMIAWISILALVIAVLCRVSFETLSNYSVSIGSQTVNLKILIPWLLASAVSLLGNSLIIVVRYYFRRIELLVETDLTKKILSEAFDVRNKKQDHRD
jgi:hypothetical protein